MLTIESPALALASGAPVAGATSVSLHAKAWDARHHEAAFAEDGARTGFHLFEDEAKAKDLRRASTERRGRFGGR